MSESLNVVPQPVAAQAPVVNVNVPVSRPVKVLLAIPTMGLDPNPQQWLESFVIVLESLKNIGAHVGLTFPYRMPWEAANNMIFKNADEGGFDYVLRMDDDVWRVPQDAVQRLFAAQKPVIGAIYPMRHFPYSMTAFVKTQDVSLEDIFLNKIFCFRMPDPPTGVQRCDLVGNGLTLINMAAIKNIPRPIFANMRGCPDDTVFCQRCAEAGVEVYAHMDVQLWHRHITPHNNLYLNNADARMALQCKHTIPDEFVRTKLIDMFGEDGCKDMFQIKTWLETKPCSTTEAPGPSAPSQSSEPGQAS